MSGCLPSRRPRSEILIELDLDVAVIELTPLGCPPAKQLLKLWVGSEDVKRPGIKSLKDLAHFFVEPSNFPPFPDSLAVRRIADDLAVLTLGAELG